jgi:hypothetical protein
VGNLVSHQGKDFPHRGIYFPIEEKIFSTREFTFLSGKRFSPPGNLLSQQEVDFPHWRIYFSNGETCVLAVFNNELAISTLPPFLW